MAYLKITDFILTLFMTYCKEKRKVYVIFCLHFITEALGLYLHLQNSMAKTYFSEKGRYTLKIIHTKMTLKTLMILKILKLKFQS